MNANDRELEALRQALRRPPAGAGAAPGCPPADRLAAAAAGELAAADLGPMVDHVTGCPACTVAWGLVRAGERATPRAAGRRRLPGGVLALAAVIVLGLGVALVWRAGGPPAPAFRSNGARVIESALPDRAVLSRDAFVLRWSVAGDADGWLYGVRVTDDRLETVARVSGLTGSTYQVPPEALAAVPEGGRVLWQVEATLPDGSRLASPTFVARAP